MSVIFFFPVVMSIAGAAMFVIGDYGVATKMIVCLLAVTAVCLQFVPVLSDSVHFLVPLFMQLTVCGWWYVASQFD